MRSKITMLESAATPIVRISPAIPGRVSVIGISLISARKNSAYTPEPERRDEPEEAVVGEQEQDDEREADEPGHEALVERLLAERRGDRALADQLELDRQRADPQRLGEVLRLAERVQPRDLGAGAAVDPVRVLGEVDDRPRLDVVVEHDREAVGVLVGRGAGDARRRVRLPRWAIRRVTASNLAWPSSVKSNVMLGWFVVGSVLCSGFVMSVPVSAGRSRITKYSGGWRFVLLGRGVVLRRLGDHPRSLGTARITLFFGCRSRGNWTKRSCCPARAG